MQTRFIIVFFIIESAHHVLLSLGVAPGLSVINDCTCQGFNQSFQCVVMGGGATIWRGSGFECAAASNEIALIHRVGAQRKCNNGAIIGRVIRNENNHYTSQLNVTVNSQLNGTSIICAHDGGEATNVVGSSLLMITTVPYPPPDDIQLVEVSPSRLTFQWGQVSSSCTAIQYRIRATDCGQCPGTTPHATASCNGISVDGHQCRLALQTITCANIVGNESRTVAVTLRVPDAPIVELIPIYSHSTKQLTGLLTRFNEVEKFNISYGVDGSATAYTVNYTESTSGIVCASIAFSATSCTNGICENEFKFASSSCSPSSIITVTAAGTNRLGTGLSSEPVSMLEITNDFIHLNFYLALKTVTCSFQNQQENTHQHVCRIMYGIQTSGKACSLRAAVSQQSATSSTSDVKLGLPLFQSQNEYCFIVTAGNGTSTVLVEGSFVAACNPQSLGDIDHTTVPKDVMCHSPLMTLSNGIENGIACYTDTYVGSTAHYYCLMCDLKTIANGLAVSQRTCMEDGYWNGTIPQCECVSTSNTCQISLGASIGVLMLLTIVITLTLITIIVIMLRSKRNLQLNLEQLGAKVDNNQGQPVIYEELGYECIKRSSPDTGENIAYLSTSAAI